MKLTTYILLFITNISFAQTSENFVNDFMLGSELKSENLLVNYNQFDFSDIWTKTQNQFIYGIIGNGHQRIRIKLISVKKNPLNSNEYFVTGKSIVKETICNFSGTIKLTKIKKVENMHFGIDNKYRNSGIKSQGILIADYEFKENPNQNHSGIFSGKLYSKWYLNSESKIKYDDIQLHSDGYMNNAFIGVWKSYSTNKKKICNWGNYRVPKANEDFDIGVGEFNVSKKYWDKGWLDIVLKNQVPNKAIKRKKATTKSKMWWEEPLSDRKSKNNCNCEGLVDWRKNLKIVIFNKPNGQAIDTVSSDIQNENFLTYKLLESQGNFFKVKIGRVIGKKSTIGWIKKNNCLGTYATNYSDSDTLFLYKHPNKKSIPIDTINKYYPNLYQILDCKEDWVKVKMKTGNKEFKGWLEPKMQCPNPYTNCN